MNLYLDSKDLINILQNGIPSLSSELNEILRKGGHSLTLSFYSVMEISAPLTSAFSNASVTTLLNQLERMPLTYIRSDIEALELNEALDAYRGHREYKGIDAFANRFDQIVDLHAQPATGIFMNYSLAETVWDLKCHDSLRGLESYANRMRQIIAADRSMPKTPAAKAHFKKVIENKLRLHNLSWVGVDLSGFAQWIYASPARCPAIRIGYEVWRKIVKNRTDSLEDSDMEDYQHLTNLPYVDAMTLDRR
ncbi:MAG: hypothetical protein H8K06_18995, partial [Nitrospira sp.]|nr:hypothetical protein [Nitrospira sp.]